MLRKLTSLAMLLTALASLAWGQKGHDVTACIAERHLTPAALQAVTDLLDGRSMIYWANWLDNASHTPAYAYTKTWHYKNVDEGERYEEAQANPAGDIVTAIKAQKETLADPGASRENRQLALKIMIHLLGDLHQPLHMGHATDLGGNRIKIRWFGREQNIHSIWDTALPEAAHKWSFTEWQQQIDRVSPDEESALIDGSVDDWAKESVAVAASVYNAYRPGSDASYDAVANAAPVIEGQLLKAGLRLAHVLNSLFDSSYAARNN